MSWIKKATDLERQEKYAQARVEYQRALAAYAGTGLENVARMALIRIERRMNTQSSISADSAPEDFDYQKYILYNNLVRTHCCEDEITARQLYLERGGCYTFEENNELRFKDAIVTLLGYTAKPNASLHTNWFPWNRFFDVFRTIGYEVEWCEFEDLRSRSTRPRIFICWNEPTSLELCTSGLLQGDDIVFQKLTSIGKGAEAANWTADPYSWCANWHWPLYRMVEHLYDEGFNIYGFGCDTISSEFPEKDRIVQKLQDRIFWIPWGGTPFSYAEVLNSTPVLRNLKEGAVFIGSRWGKIGRGNIDAWDRYLTPLQESGKIDFYKYGGIDQEFLSDKEMIARLQEYTVCPIIHAPSWQAEQGVQDRFYTVFLAGRFGICDNVGAIRSFGPEIQEICTEDPEEYFEKTLHYAKNPEQQRTYIEYIQHEIKAEKNFYQSWYNVMTSDAIAVEPRLKTRKLSETYDAIHSVIHRPLDITDWPKRIIVTAADENWYGSLSTLLRDLYRDNDTAFTHIYVYDIGLSDRQRKVLSEIPRVTVVSDLRDAAIEDGRYKSRYLFKVESMYDVNRHVTANAKTFVLYLDAGVRVGGKGISGIFQHIEQHGHFLCSMDTRTAWGRSGNGLRLFNHLPPCNRISDSWLSEEVLAEPLLWAGVVGYKLRGKFFDTVICEQKRWSRCQQWMFEGPKFPENEVYRRACEDRQVFQETLERVKKDARPLCTERFIGHRQDQFVLSYIAHSRRFKYWSSTGLIEDVTETTTSKKNHEGYKEDKMGKPCNEARRDCHAVIHRGLEETAGLEKYDELVPWLTPDNERIKDLVRGKRVAIIGPAPHVHVANSTEFINSYDIVTRINKYRPTPESVESTGARCDLLVHCLSETEECGGLISQVPIEGETPIIAPYALLEDPRGTSFEEKHGNIANVYHYYRKYCNPLYLPKDAEYRELEEALGGTRPNTGFAGIVYLLRMRPKELYVTGFTFFRGGYDKGYRSESEGAVLTKMAAAGFHDQEKQLEYFVAKLISDEKLVCDRKVLEIVNRVVLESAKPESRFTLLGNGPSLANIDLKHRRGEITVSYNRAFLVYEERNFYPVFYFCIDKAVLLNCLGDIESLLDSPVRKFVLLECPETEHLKEHPKVDLVSKTNENAPFFGDVATFSCNYLMERYGARKFSIYGCDCEYVEDLERLGVDVEENPSDKARRIVLKPREGGQDPNHFIPNYFGEGTEYSVPRTENHLDAWRNIAEKASNVGCEVRFETSSKAEQFFRMNASCRI